MGTEELDIKIKAQAQTSQANRETGKLRETIKKLVKDIEAQNKQSQKSANITRTLTIEKNKEGKATAVVLNVLRKEVNAKGELNRVVNKYRATQASVVGGMMREAGASKQLTSATIKQIEATRNLSLWQKISGGQWASSFPTLAKLNNAFNTLRWTMVNVGFAAAAIIGPFALLTKAGAEFSFQISRVAILTGKSSEEVIKSLDAIRQNTIFTLDEMIQAYTEFVKLGFSGEAALKALKPIADLATAGFTDLETATRVTGQVMQQFNIPVTDVERVVNVLARGANMSAAEVESFGEALSYAGGIAALSGQSLEQTAAAIALLTNAGMSGSRAGTSLASSLNKMVNPTKEVKDLMYQVGVNFFDSNNKMKDMGEIISDLSTSLERYNQEAQLAFLTEAFGARGGRAINQLIVAFRQTGDTLEDVVSEMEELASAAEMSADVAEDSGAKWKKWGAALGSTFKKVGKGFSDLFAGVIEGAIKIFNFASGAVGSFFDKMVEMGLAVKYVKDVVTEVPEVAGPKVGEPEIKAGDLSLVTNEIERMLNELETVNLTNYQNALRDINQKYEEYIRRVGETFEVNGRLITITREMIDTWRDSAIAALELEQAVDEMSDSFGKYSRVMNAAIGIVQDHLSELSSGIKDTRAEISDLLRRPFAGQTAMERRLFQARQAINLQRLAILRLGESSEDTTNKLQKTQEEHQAWVETIRQFIRTTLKEGKDLGKDVTGIVKTFQTKLLGINFMKGTTARGKSPEEERLEDLQREYDILRLQFDTTYGAMREELRLWDTEQQVAHSNLFGSVEGVKSAIVSQRDRLNELQSEYDRWSSKLEKARNDLDETKLSILGVEYGLEDLADSGILAFDKLINKAKEYLSVISRISVDRRRRERISGAYGEEFTTKLYAAVATAKDAGEVFEKMGYRPPRSDFVMRPGQPPVSFSSQDTIVGFKGGITPGTNITFGNIIIQGGANVTTEELQLRFAQVIKKELSTIRAR